MSGPRPQRSYYHQKALQQIRNSLQPFATAESGSTSSGISSLSSNNDSSISSTSSLNLKHGAGAGCNQQAHGNANHCVQPQSHHNRHNVTCVSRHNHNHHPCPSPTTAKPPPSGSSIWPAKSNPPQPQVKQKRTGGIEYRAQQYPFVPSQVPQSVQQLLRRKETPSSPSSSSSNSPTSQLLLNNSGNSSVNGSGTPTSYYGVGSSPAPSPNASAQAIIKKPTHIIKSTVVPKPVLQTASTFQPPPPPYFSSNNNSNSTTSETNTFQNVMQNYANGMSPGSSAPSLHQSTNYVSCAQSSNVKPPPLPPKKNVVLTPCGYINRWDLAVNGNSEEKGFNGTENSQLLPPPLPPSNNFGGASVTPPSTAPPPYDSHIANSKLYYPPIVARSSNNAIPALMPKLPPKVPTLTTNPSPETVSSISSTASSSTNASGSTHQVKTTSNKIINSQKASGVTNIENTKSSIIGHLTKEVVIVDRLSQNGSNSPSSMKTSPFEQSRANGNGTPSSKLHTNPNVCSCSAQVLKGLDMEKYLSLRDISLNELVSNENMPSNLGSNRRTVTALGLSNSKELMAEVNGMDKVTSRSATRNKLCQSVNGHMDADAKAVCSSENNAQYCQYRKAIEGGSDKGIVKNKSVIIKNGSNESGSGGTKCNGKVSSNDSLGFEGKTQTPKSSEKGQKNTGVSSPREHKNKLGLPCVENSVSAGTVDTTSKASDEPTCNGDAKIHTHESPRPERKKLCPEKEKERFESKLRVYSPQAFKFFMEQHVENVIKTHRERINRRMQLESEMAKIKLSEEDKEQMRKMLCQKESNYIRLKRAKMDKSMFKHIKTIGVGAFGEVALVSKRDTYHLYAMKTLRKSDVLRRNQVAHVKAERDILAEADNEWVVKLYYSFQDADNLYFVMDYIPGGDLMSLLIKKGIFEEHLAQFYIAELTCAVESVHKMGFIHRDIKPDNILIDSEGHIKLTDFGLCTGFRWTHNSKYYQENKDPLASTTCHCEASFDFGKHGTHVRQLCDGCADQQKDRKGILERRRRREKNRCLAHSLVGTPNYIAPEVLMRMGYTQKCDWWSVGVILYEMLVGQPPFYAPTPAETQYKVINWQNSLRIPSHAELSNEAKDLILKLCSEHSSRIGEEEIKSHPFLASIDFKCGLRKCPAPYKPAIMSPTDTSNFDPCEEDRPMNDDTNNNDSNQSHGFFEFTFRRFFDDGPVPRKNDLFSPNHSTMQVINCPVQDNSGSVQGNNDPVYV